VPAGGATGEVEPEEEEYTLKSHKDFKSSVYFPNHPEKRFPVGTRTTLLLGVHNIGKTPFNISYIYANLHSPFDFSYYIQNFTVRQYNTIILPGEQATIDYTFIPDKSLEPLDFWFSAHVIYNDTVEQEMYFTTFFNGTIELIEKPTEYNFRRIFTIFLFIAIAGIVAQFLFQRSSLSKPSKNTSQSGPAEWKATKHKQDSTSKKLKKK